MNLLEKRLWIVFVYLTERPGIEPGLGLVHGPLLDDANSAALLGHGN